MTIVVNGERIEDAVIQAEADRLKPDHDRVFADTDPKERRMQLLDWSKENVIERVLINQYAAKHGGPVPEAEIKSVLAEMKKRHTDRTSSVEIARDKQAELRKAVTLQLKVERVIRDITGEAANPAKKAVRDFYDENKQSYRSPEMVRVAHIVKHIDARTDENAARSIIEKVQEELENGTIFEMLAAKYSDCPDNGGDLGYIRTGQMVEEFEDVVFNMGPGQTSGVFRTRFGFHIAKVYDRKASTVPPLKEIESRIVNDLRSQIETEAIDKFIDKLKAEAKIEEI